MRLVSILSTFVLPTLLIAQAYQGEGPGHMAAARTNPSLGATSLGVAEVAQLLLTPIAGSRHYLTATVRRIGATNWDLLAGEFDEATQVFVPSNDVVHFNSSGDEFALTVSTDRLVAVFDTPTSAMWASRASVALPFGAPAPVQNVPTGYIDPQLCKYDGELHLMFLWGRALWIGRFENGVVFFIWPLVIAPSVQLHSPSPMTAADGEMKALIFSRVGSGSSAWFQSNLDVIDDTAPHQILDRGSWLGNPDANGGRVRYAEAGVTYTDPVELELVAVAAAEAPTRGGVGALDLVLFAPTRTSTEPTLLGTVALGVLGTGPLPLPFLGGSALSLDPTSLVMLAPAPVDRDSGTLRYRIDLPPLPELTLHAVPLVLDSSLRGFLGNAGLMKVRNKEAECAKVDARPVDANGNCPAGYTRHTTTAGSSTGGTTYTNCYKCPAGPCAGGTACTIVKVSHAGIHGFSYQRIHCYCR